MVQPHDRAMAQYRAHEEQPGLEVAREAEAPQYVAPTSARPRRFQVSNSGDTRSALMGRFDVNSFAIYRGVSLTVNKNRVFYEQGLELNHAQHNRYSTQQYGHPPPFDPYRQSTYTGSSPAFSALTPASDGKIPFGGPPPTAMEKPPGDSVHLRIGKKKLWLILGSLAVILVLGLSLGLGLGLGLSQSGEGSSR